MSSPLDVHSPRLSRKSKPRAVLEGEWLFTLFELKIPPRVNNEKRQTPRLRSHDFFLSDLREQTIFHERAPISRVTCLRANR